MSIESITAEIDGTRHDQVITNPETGLVFRGGWLPTCVDAYSHCVLGVCGSFDQHDDNDHYHRRHHHRQRDHYGHSRGPEMFAINETLTGSEGHLLETLAEDGEILSITKPDPRQLRSRRVVARSRARPTGKYPSWKMGRMIQWESPNELNIYRLLDASPEVSEFYEQPFEILYRLGGEVHRHYPDVLVRSSQCQELWEVKPYSNAISLETATRSELMRQKLPDHGYTYRLILAESLSRNPRLANVLTLLRYGRNPIPMPDRERLRRLVSITGHLPWRAGIEGTLGPKGRDYLCRLVLEGMLIFDVERPLTAATILSPRAPSSTQLSCLGS